MTNPVTAARKGHGAKFWARYHWKGQYEHVRAYVAACHECQLFATRIQEEELWPTEPPSVLFGWITIDVVCMPPGRFGRKFLVVCRCAMSHWAEARALEKNDSHSVMRFLQEDVFCRWGLPIKMSADGGSENEGLVLDLPNQWGINRVISSAYHPQGQGLIERGYAPLVNALKKLPGAWDENLWKVLWADRVTVKRSTNETPAFLVSGKEHILPIELSIPTWQVLPWDQVTDTESLLAMRARQFDRRDERLRESIDRTVRLRHENKDYFDEQKVTRSEHLEVGDLVLLKDSFTANDKSTVAKFKPKWQGPFRINKAGKKGWYNLAELDGTKFRSQTPGNRLKKFQQRKHMELELIDELLGQDRTTVWTGCTSTQTTRYLAPTK